MANTLKIKRGTAATIPQGQLAEPLFTTDTYDLYIGKGSGGNQRIQNYIASGTSSQFLKGDGSLDSTTYQATSEKGQNNGYASLDSGGKIPASQLPSSVIEYKGTWNASTNTPTLADGTGDAGDVYIVSVGGTQNLGSGSITFDAGDWVMYNGSVWQKSTGSNAVASVNGQTGIVSIGVNDLDDATITSVSNGQLLQYSTGTNKWINWTPTYISAAITSLNGLTAATQTFANDTNVTITSATSTHTIGWSGQLAISRGGTGLSALGTAGQLLRVNSGATALEYFTPTYISAAITSLNGLTAATQTFANDTNVTITSATSTHTIGWNGQLSVARGGTGAASFTSGRILYGNGTSAIATSSNLFYDATNNRLGIGNDSPSAQLYIRSGGSLTNTDQNNRLVIERDNHAYILFSSPDNFDQGIHFHNTTDNAQVGRIAYLHSSAGDTFAVNVQGSRRLDITAISSTFQTSVIGNSFIPTGSTVPTNGMYLSAANTLDFSTNSTNRFSISSSGAATFSSAAAGYGLSVTNVEDSSQGLLVRSTDNDTTLYLARFQSSVGATSQTWVDRFSIAKNGSTVIGDNIPAVNVRLWVKGSDQTASNYAMDVTDSAGQSIAWFRNDKAIRFYGALTGTSATFSSSSSEILRINPTTSGYISWYRGATWAGYIDAESGGDMNFANATTTGSLKFTTNSSPRLTISSTGAATFSSSVSANGISSIGQEQAFTWQRTSGTASDVYSLNADSGSAYLYNNTTAKSLMSWFEGQGVQAEGSFSANSPAAGRTGEGIIAGTSFKIDASGTGQKAKMYVVSKDLSDTYGSGLQIQFANQADDKGFGFNLTTAGTYETYVKDSGASWQRRMVIKQDGNFGIGESNPLTKLHVSSSTGQNDTYGYIQTHYTGSSSSANSGYTAKNYNGTSQFMQWDANGLRIGSRIMTNNGAGRIYFTYGNDNEGLILMGDGSLQNPTHPTTANAANMYMTVAGTIYRSTSSLKYKKNIQDYNKGLFDLLKMRPVSFEGKSKEDEGKIFAGFIAEEIDALGLSEYVVYAEDGNPESLHYGSMTAILVKAIQEQQAQIEELKSKLA